MNLGPIVDRIMVSLKMFRYSPQKRLDRTLLALKWKGDVFTVFGLTLKGMRVLTPFTKKKKKKAKDAENPLSLDL